MEYNIFDVNKACYELANLSGWNISELQKEVVKSRYYKFGINKLSMQDIIINALAYAKKTDYMDMLIQRIARKNGKEFAYKVFRIVFPEFKSITELYDYCYHLCEENDSLREIAKEVGINGTLIKYYAQESKLGIIRENAERLEKRRKNVETNYPLYYNAINFLLEHDDKEEIIDYFKNIDKSFEGRYLMVYASSMFPSKSVEELREKIRKKYDIYVNYKRMVLDANDEIKGKASLKIKKFIDGIYPNILSFCTMEKMEKKKFFYYLNIVKVHNPNLYDEYKEKALKIKNKEYSISFLELKKIVEYISNGIEGRDFNLLDYYKLTSYDLNTFYHLVENSLDEYEYHRVSDFYRKYKNMELLTEKYIFNERREFYCDLDDKGLPIPGTGHLVTKEEKKEIIDMIKNDGYKLYGPIYNLYLKNYFNEEKGKVLKKSL